MLIHSQAYCIDNDFYNLNLDVDKIKLNANCIRDIQVRPNPTWRLDSLWLWSTIRIVACTSLGSLNIRETNPPSPMPSKKEKAASSKEVHWLKQNRRCRYLYTDGNRLLLVKNVSLTNIVCRWKLWLTNDKFFRYTCQRKGVRLVNQNFLWKLNHVLIITNTIFGFGI